MTVYTKKKNQYTIDLQKFETINSKHDKVLCRLKQDMRNGVSGW